MRSDPVLAVLASLVMAAVPVSTRAGESPPTPLHVRGVIVGQTGDQLEIETGPGKTERVTLPADVKVAAVEDADASALTKGEFIGTTAVRQPDGTLRALEVHLFPETMRGAGEGHRPWDLAPRSSMTNATVASVRTSPARKTSMTNATVSELTRAGAMRTLVLEYPGGHQTVVVPPHTPIVQIEPGDRSLLVAGAHVIAFAVPGRGGALVAQRLTVGRGGVVPPM
jgi:hypothetical protein